MLFPFLGAIEFAFSRFLLVSQESFLLHCPPHGRLSVHPDYQCRAIGKVEQALRTDREQDKSRRKREKERQ